eukprot:CAMPEP_0119305172 /NCGR_PEP_ID=MMETSP1333-20130426/6225_1 /TAXON_ID=418940 /ORGANISM="Scyphosphaera apsteinii, Strain RCC1455" /LENGTH=519 /DNA_ID=CAMNT_0007308195 /DNA_START=413 /DNA_END=1969 /DNA_ORIENTATION=+
MSRAEKQAYGPLDAWRPVFDCGEFAQRWPDDGKDGGKWLCGATLMKKEQPCHLLSVGSNFNDKFERLLHRKTGCLAHIVDPTLKPPDAVSRFRSSLADYNATLVSEVGLGHSSSFKTVPLATLLQRTILKTRLVEFLKLDCESCEIDVLPELAALCIEGLHVVHLNIEMHVRAGFFNPSSLLRALHAPASACGMLLFHKEATTMDGGLPHNGWLEEFAWVSKKRAALVSRLRSWRSKLIESSQTFADATRVSMRSLQVGDWKPARVAFIVQTLVSSSYFRSRFATKRTATERIARLRLDSLMRQARHAMLYVIPLPVISAESVNQSRYYGALMHECPSLTPTMAAMHLSIVRFWKHMVWAQEAVEFAVLLEDDVELPPSFAALVATSLHKLVRSQVIWLDSRSGAFNSTEVGSCCTSAIAFRTSFLPHLLAAFDIASPNNHVGQFCSHRRGAFDLHLARFVTHFSKVRRLTELASRVPMVGTIGLPSLLERTGKDVLDTHTQQPSTSDYWPWYLNNQTW